MREFPPLSEFSATRKMAEGGDAQAQSNLGVMYANGYGVPRDHAEAVKWFRKAAEQGLAYARFNLGVAYYKGEGVAKDYAVAARWYRKAADHGHASSQFHLGIAYFRGEGVPKDNAEAYAWFNLAAISIEDARKRRDELEKHLTNEQKARAQQRSTELHELIEARMKVDGK